MSIKYEPAAQVCVACADMVFLIYAMRDGVVIPLISHQKSMSLKYLTPKVYEP